MSSNKGGKTRAMGGRKAGQLRSEGSSPAFNGLMVDGSFYRLGNPARPSGLLLNLAAKTWHDVTGGAGVVLHDGKPVKPVTGADYE